MGLGLGLGLGVAVQRAVAPLADAAAAVAQCRLPVARTHEGRAAAVARTLLERPLVPLARDAAQHATPLVRVRVRVRAGVRDRDRGKV